jgi:hypothetical protein
VLGALRLGQLPAQTGFAHAWLPNEADDLPTALGALHQEVAQGGQLALSAHKTTQGAFPVDFKRGTARSHPHDGVDAISEAYAR